MTVGVLATAVCLSVTSRCSIETDGWVDLVFGMEASFNQLYTVSKGNSGIYKTLDLNILMEFYTLYY